MRTGPSAYLYSHPSISETFKGLTSAKKAFLLLIGNMPPRPGPESAGDPTRDHDRPMQEEEDDDALDMVPESAGDPTRDHDRPIRAHALDVLPAGSESAVDAIRGARWPGTTVAGFRAISRSIEAKLDVVVVDSACMQDDPASRVCADWTRDTLVERHGYVEACRSTLVIGKQCKTVLGLFVLGRDIGNAFRRTAGPTHMRGAYRLLRDSMIPGQRRGIFMFGLRFNPQETVAKRMQACYYRTRSQAKAVRLVRHCKTVIDCAAGICAAERLVAPEMAARRTMHARMCRSPGIFPGVSIKTCPATSLGMSMGYRSPPHLDAPHNNQAETIAYCSEGVPTSAGLVFALPVPGVLLSLTADTTSLVMVPGNMLHGTPAARPGHRDHACIGAVVISKANLLNAAAQEDISWIRWRIRTGNAASNPFMPGYAVRPGTESCRVCGDSDREDQLLLCDVCNSGMHADCCGMNGRVPKGSYVCDACSKLSQQ